MTNPHRLTYPFLEAAEVPRPLDLSSHFVSRIFQFLESSFGEPTRSFRYHQAKVCPIRRQMHPNDSSCILVWSSDQLKVLSVQACMSRVCGSLAILARAKRQCEKEGFVLFGRTAQEPSSLPSCSLFSLFSLVRSLRPQNIIQLPPPPTEQHTIVQCFLCVATSCPLIICSMTTLDLSYPVPSPSYSIFVGSLLAELCCPADEHTVVVHGAVDLVDADELLYRVFLCKPSYMISWRESQTSNVEHWTIECRLQRTNLIPIQTFSLCVHSPTPC